jgi:hypothetical protein
MTEPLEIWAVLAADGHVLAAFDNRSDAEKHAMYCRQLKPLHPPTTYCRYVYPAAVEQACAVTAVAGRDGVARPKTPQLDLDGISELAYGLSLIERGDPFRVDYDHMGDLLYFARLYLERELAEAGKAEAEGYTWADLARWCAVHPKERRIGCNQYGPDRWKVWAEWNDDVVCSGGGPTADAAACDLADVLATRHPSSRLPPPPASQLPAGEMDQ